MKNSVTLTEMPTNYTGGHSRLEVLDFSANIHDKPGVYLQFVEGCGYTYYEMTPEQAERLARILIAKAEETRKNFAK